MLPTFLEGSFVSSRFWFRAAPSFGTGLADAASTVSVEHSSSAAQRFWSPSVFRRALGGEIPGGGPTFFASSDRVRGVFTAALPVSPCSSGVLGAPPMRRPFFGDGVAGADSIELSTELPPFAGDDTFELLPRALPLPSAPGTRTPLLVTAIRFGVVCGVTLSSGGSSPGGGATPASLASSFGFLEEEPPPAPFDDDPPRREFAPAASGPPPDDALLPPGDVDSTDPGGELPRGDVVAQPCAECIPWWGGCEAW